MNEAFSHLIWFMSGYHISEPEKFARAMKAFKAYNETTLTDDEIDIIDKVINSTEGTNG